ncbi:amino acid adenylation domain-containing protein [bacterium]|nr:amino acid adenylation domain-containing protein [bacterium]
MNSQKIQHILPLTPMQEGLLFHALQSSNPETYFEQIAFKLHGDLDHEILFRSLGILIERHDVLRTLFIFSNVEKPKQIVLHQRRSDPFFRDLGSETCETAEYIIAAYKKQDRVRGFDISRDPLIRLALFRLSPDDFQIVLSFHHLILDGWSLGLLLEEWFDIYFRFTRNEVPDTQKNHQFREFVQWVVNQDHRSACLYWGRLLEGLQSPSLLPFKRSPGQIKDYIREEAETVFEHGTTRQIMAFAQKNRVTLNVYMQTLWGLLLQRYTDSDDVVFGTVVSGRQSRLNAVDRTVGLLINTVPVRLTAGPGTALSELLQQVQKQIMNSGQHDFCGLSEIQSGSGFSGGLFDHVLVFENYIKDAVIGALSGESRDFHFKMTDVDIFEQTNYDFNLLFMPGDRLRVRIIFNAARYAESDIGRILAHFRHIVQETMLHPEVAVHDYCIVPEAEKHLLMHGFQAEIRQIAPFRPVQVLVEEQAARMPEQIAVMHENRTITYGSLNRRANRLAGYLKEQGIGPDSIVGVYMRRSSDLCVALLAVLKAGGAYLPIDTRTPSARITKIIGSSGMRLILAQSTVSLAPEPSVPVIPLDQVEYLQSYSDSNPACVTKSRHLIYVIYTSGSTGEPKGVMIEHGSFHTLLSSHDRLFGLTAGDRCTLTASPAFDAMAFELWPGLAAGARMFIAPDRVIQDPVGMFRFIQDNRITFSFQATAVAEALIGLPWPEDTPIRVLCTAGDRLRKSPVTNLPFKFYNLYGPTEDTIWTTVHRLRDPDPGLFPPIGKPLPGHTVYILNRHYQLQPVNVPGELTIGGPGLARGYMNDPELDRNKFIPDPGNPDARLYRTGDIASWNERGELRFVGRADFQVKIGGNRIEPGEIEACLMTHDHVSDCAVIAIHSGPHPALAAYYTSGTGLKPDSVRKHLDSLLPPYMVPHTVIHLDAIPRTSNGKVDRDKLPLPQKSQIVTEHMAPRDPVEIMLAETWSRILGQPDIGIYDNFFDMGGNSLKAIEVQSNWLSDYEIHVQDLYDFPTIAELAGQLKKRKNSLKKMCDEMCRLADVPGRDMLRSSLEASVGQYRYQIADTFPRAVEERRMPEKVLITGATGFLGIHLLHDLLQSYGTQVHCIVRAESEDAAWQRLNGRFRFYFDQNLRDMAEERIQVHPGDVTDMNLGLDIRAYNNLAEKLDCIIHAAADVRHAGHHSDFHRVNVRGVETCIALARSGQDKIIHHISTLSTGLAFVDGPAPRLFTEFDENTAPDSEETINRLSNPYIRSKLQGESLLFMAREEGVDARCYRVGNLVCHSKSGRFQFNIQDNAFYKMIRSLLLLRMVPDTREIEFDFSYIDTVSSVIMALISNAGYAGHNFHVFNPRACSLRELGELLQQTDNPPDIVPVRDFIDRALDIWQRRREHHVLNLVEYLHVLISEPNRYLFPVCEKTCHMAGRSPGDWPVLDAERLNQMIQYGHSVKYW